MTFFFVVIQLIKRSFKQSKLGEYMKKFAVANSWPSVKEINKLKTDKQQNKVSSGLPHCLFPLRPPNHMITNQTRVTLD